MSHPALPVIGLLAALAGLPMLGVWLAGRPVGPYLEFPPLTRSVEHAGFSWPAFLFFVTVEAAMLAPVAIAFLRTSSEHERREQERRPAGGASSAFPWWGWAGALWTLGAWTLAWSRFEWFAPLQPFTFGPLWLGYIVVVNALTCWRTGGCMLRDRPRFMLKLFGASAGFWWFFEYLNRFVQNWYYVGVGHFSATEYVIYATLPFATVLPAVLGTAELLASWPRLTRALRGWRPIRLARPRAVGWLVLVGAAVGLAGLGLWPDLLYPLLWVAPLLIITSFAAIRGEETLFTPLRDGDWRPIYLPALAALVCGVFWEMWNFYSQAKWIYTVPYVGRYQVFEMPVVGFGGYLPFGLECALVGSLVSRERRPPDHERRARQQASASARA